MRLTLERFGGLAGMHAKPLVVDTSGLPAAQAQPIEALAQQVLDERSGRAEEAAPSPDAFGYELTIESASERSVVSFEYADASVALKQLLQALRAKSP